MAADKISLGAQTLMYPMPALLVGTYDMEGKPNIMTAAWGGICSSEPPCLGVGIRPSRHTHSAILQRKAFTISIPSTRLAAETDFAGIAGGKTVNKFAAANLTAVKSGLVDAPYVAECPIVLELELLHSLELGSHTWFVGKILDVKADADCMGERQQPEIARIDPLIFDSAQRGYHAVGKRVATAFSAGKTLFPSR